MMMVGENPLYHDDYLYIYIYLYIEWTYRHGLQEYVWGVGKFLLDRPEGPFLLTNFHRGRVVFLKQVYVCPFAP